jgi:hypothetical protein
MGWCAATPLPTCACLTKATWRAKSSKAPSRCLRGFDRVQESRDLMRGITLDDGESEVFARAALAFKYDDPNKPAPVTESQILMPRRFDDRRPDLWSVFNRTQENLTKGGLHGRSRQWPQPAHPPRAGH